MFNTHSKTFTYGDTPITLETGRIARQSNGAVMVSAGDARVLVTVVGRREAKPGQSFFPLTVNYQEKTYAAGRIPGGFFRREGRPTESETLISRLIDRPLRPLFPKGFMNEVQVIATVLSASRDDQTDVLALLGSSAALAVSGLPFNGPIGAARVGFIDNNYVLNPGLEAMENSQLDMVVAGTQKALIMVESEAGQLSEDQMLGALLFGHQEMQVAIQAITELAAEAGKPAWELQPKEENAALQQQMAEQYKEQVAEAYQITQKAERQQCLDALRSNIRDNQSEEYNTEEQLVALSKMEKEIVRGRILEGGQRIDGREHNQVRPLAMEVGLLPRAHGSALFTRGETQALVTVTLGSERDAQQIENLRGMHRDNFMLHYNFPPFSVGETGFVGSPKRREIGHGRLARRGVSAVLPTLEEFPYVLRVVSEITESNGSSSMASVCGTSMALMQAGVPIKSQVAGIAMGLVKDGERFAVLSDILGDEDHLGDMDFKVTGTATGITALQMDIKIEGIDEVIMEKAIQQAGEGIRHILAEMDKTIAEPRSELSEHAPKRTTLIVDTDKIRDIIGRGGATIKSIAEESGATINVEDDGTVNIFASDSRSSDIAVERINEITAEPEIGEVYPGTVVSITDFGAFVRVGQGKDGLVHISQIAEERVENVNDYLEQGQEVQVRVMDIDSRGRIKLTMKGINPEETGEQTNDE